MPQKDPTYIDKLYGALQQDESVKLTISKEEFSKRIGGDDVYREKVYGALQKSPKVKLTIGLDEFTNRTRDDISPGKPSPDGSGVPSVNQTPDLQGGSGQPQTGSRAFDPFAKSREAAQQQMPAPTTEQPKAQPNVFDPIKQYREVGPGVPENAAQKRNAKVSEFEAIQKAYADAANIPEKSITGVGTIEQRNELMVHNAAREKVLAETKKAADASQERLLEVTKPIIENTLGEGKYRSYLTKSGQGIDVIDPLKIANKADQIAIQNGQPTDGYFRRNIYNSLKSEATFKIIEGDVNKTFNQKIQPLLDENQKKIAQGFVADEAENAKYEQATKLLATDLSTQQQAEADAITQNYKSLVQTSPEPPSYDSYLQSINAVNSKYNKRFQRESDELRKIAESNITKAAEKYQKELPEDPELDQKIKDLYQKSFNEVFNKRQNQIQDSDEASAQMGNPLIFPASGQLAMFSKSTANGLGGALRGLGAYTGLQSVEDLGDYMEQRFTISPPKTSSFSDLLDITNLSKLSGQLGGGMAPTMVAASAVAVGTRGAGLNTAIQMVSSSLASFTAESADMAGRAYADAFEKTGNAGDAEIAAKKTMDSQMDIILAYSLDALPFVGNILEGIGSKVARVGVGAGAEFTTELAQESLANIAEENISKGGEAWDGLAEKITDPTRLKQTAISIAPVAILGGVGQVNSQSRIQRLSGYYSAQQAKANLNGIVEDQGRQFVQSIVFNEGEKTALATINALYSSGQINDDIMQQMTDNVTAAVEVEKTAKAAKLNDSGKQVYAFYSGRANEAKRKAAETNDPILSKVYQQQAKDYENAGVEFLQSGEADLIGVTYKDGSQYIMSTDDIRQAPENKKFISDIKSGKVKIEAYGKVGGKLVEDLGVKIDEQDKVAAEQTAQRKKQAEEQRLAFESQPEALTPDEIKAKESLGEKIYAVEDVDTMLEEDEVIEKCPPGYVRKAANGAKTSFRPGGKWEIVHEFKGKSHKEGGIDIEIVGGKVKASNEDGSFKAEDGAVWQVDGAPEETEYEKAQRLGDVQGGLTTSVATAINPIVGGIVGLGQGLGDKARTGAEATDENGNLINRRKARTMSILGSFLDPLKALTTRASYKGGFGDITGDKYLASIESSAKSNLPPEALPPPSNVPTATQQQQQGVAGQVAGMRQQAGIQQPSVTMPQSVGNSFGTEVSVQPPQLTGGLQTIQINGGMYGYDSTGNFIKLT